MSHGDLKDFFGVEILEHCMDKYAKNEQRRLLWWKNEARRQEQRGAENFSAIEIAPKISQITGLYCSKIRTFTQGPGARCPATHDALTFTFSNTSLSLLTFSHPAFDQPGTGYVMIYSIFFRFFALHMHDTQAFLLKIPQSGSIFLQ